jgi:predicted permease
MRYLTSDLRLGVRQLLRNPGFALAAIASLALGIGLNVSLFSIVNAVLLRDARLTDPDRLVEIYSGIGVDYPQLTTSYPDFLEIQRGAPALAGVVSSGYVRGILGSGGRGLLVTGEAVTANYFDVLGIPLVLGRGFRDDENIAPGRNPVIVMGEGLWRRQFAGGADIVGRTVELSGHSYIVVGVAPAQFTGMVPGIPTEFWVPTMMVERLVFSGVQASTDTDPGTTRIERRGTRWLFVRGRLAPGRNIGEARAQLETIFARLRTEYPATNDKVTVTVLPAANVRFHPALDGYIRAASAGLLGAVGIVLLIACANVANLLLAKGVARQRELAIRSALGANRGRLITQLLSETIVLAGAGGTAGVIIAWSVGAVITGFGSSIFPSPIRFDFTIDRTVLLFALVASVGTACICGLAPAWSASKFDLVPALKVTERGGRQRRVTLRDVLVVGQIAASLVLLVAGALLGRGLLAAQNTDLGFDPRPLSSLSFNLKMNGYDMARAMAMRDRAHRELRALPGVVAVTTASRLPLSPEINIEGVRIPGHHAPSADPTPVDAVTVGADYFVTVNVPIVAGRSFTEDDVVNERRVAVVNETFARQYWPDGSAVGRTIYTSGFESPPHQIVGVARDHKVRSVGESPRPYLHLPSGASESISLVVRTTVSPQTALPMLRQALLAIEPEIVFTSDLPAEEVAATTVAPTRLGAIALGLFGALALGLAAVGLYGVVSYTASRRTREVGIRMALGAQRQSVLRLLLAQGGRLALVGVGIGVLAAAGLGRLLESLLYGVSSVDPVAYAVAAGVLLVVAGVANVIPAVAAARLDPVRALRSE